MPTQTNKPTVGTGVVPRKSLPKWVKVGGVIAVVLVVAIAVALFIVNASTRDAQKVSDQLVNDLQAGNTDAAYDLTGQTFRQSTSKEQLDGIVKQVGPFIQGEEKNIGRAIVQPAGHSATAVFVYSVKASNGNNYIKVELQKDNNDWRILNFRTSSETLDTTVD